METGLPQLKGKLQAMAVLAEDMVDRAVKALLEGDAAVAHQVCSDDDLAGNLARAERGVAEAAECGAKFVALPENFAYMRREGGKFPCAQGPDGEIVAALRGWI